MTRLMIGAAVSMLVFIPKRQIGTVPMCPANHKDELVDVNGLLEWIREGAIAVVRS